MLEINSLNVDLPQSRSRIFICGRRSAAFLTPAPRFSPEDVMIAKPRLRDLLSTLEPIVDRASLTPQQSYNLEFFESKVQEVIHKLPPWAVMCFDLSRSPDAKRAPQYRLDDAVCCLTASNGALWVQGTGAVPEMHQFGRWLTPSERFMLQGMSGFIVNLMPTARACVTAAGNAMSVPSIGLVIAYAFQDHRF